MKGCGYFSFSGATQGYLFIRSDNQSRNDPAPCFRIDSAFRFIKNKFWTPRPLNNAGYLFLGGEESINIFARDSYVISVTSIVNTA